MTGSGNENTFASVIRNIEEGRGRVMRSCSLLLSERDSTGRPLISDGDDSNGDDVEKERERERGRGRRIKKKASSRIGSSLRDGLQSANWPPPSFPRFLCTESLPAYLTKPARGHKLHRLARERDREK